MRSSFPGRSTGEWGGHSPQQDPTPRNDVAPGTGEPLSEIESARGFSRPGWTRRARPARLLHARCAGRRPLRPTTRKSCRLSAGPLASLAASTRSPGFVERDCSATTTPWQRKWRRAGALGVLPSYGHDHSEALGVPPSYGHDRSRGTRVLPIGARDHFEALAVPRNGWRRPRRGTRRAPWLEKGVSGGHSECLEAVSRTVLGHSECLEAVSLTTSEHFECLGSVSSTT